jgi:hypothetical protein
MQPLIACNLCPWIEAHRQAFEPPVGNNISWEASPFTAMPLRGPHARRAFHSDPSDDIFDRLFWSLWRSFRAPPLFRSR